MLPRGVGNIGGGGILDKELPSTYFETVQGLTPLVYWRLNEAAGSTATAWPTTGFDGLYTGATIDATTGVDGAPVPYFDGSNDYVNIKSTDLHDNMVMTSGTISLWFKRTEYSSLRPMLQLLANSSNRISLQQSSLGALYLYINQAGAARILANGSAPSSNVWYHAAVRWDSLADDVSSNAIQMFLDGALVHSTDATSLAWDATSLTSCYIGQRAGISGPWKGNLAHVALCNNVLSDANILTLAGL